MSRVLLLALLLAPVAGAQPPVVAPKAVPPLTPEQQRQAEAAALKFMAENPGGFPTGANLLPAATAKPAGPRQWSKIDGGRLTARLTLNDGHEFEWTAYSNYGDEPLAVLTLTGYATLKNDTLFGTVVMVEARDETLQILNRLAEAGSPQVVSSYSLEGSSFVAKVIQKDGRLQLGQLRCSATPGDAAVVMSHYFNGTYQDKARTAEPKGVPAAPPATIEGAGIAPGR